MKSKDKSKENIEIDDMNIKSHLDTSLDLNGISVSEDLINRTLEAIKKQTAVQPMEEKNLTNLEKRKRVIAWNKYIRSFAGIAAAAVIIVAGYHLVNNIPTGNEKTEFSADSLVSEDIVNQEVGTAESGDINSTLSASMVPKMAEDESTKMDGASTGSTEANDNSGLSANSTTEAVTAPQFTIAAGVLAEDSGEGTSGTTGSTGDKTKVGVTSNDTTYGLADTTPSDSDNSDTNRSTLGSTAPNDQADNSSTSDTASIVKSKLAVSATSDLASITSDQPASAQGLVGDTFLTFRGIFLSEPEQAEYVMITDEVSNISVTLTDQADIQDFYSVMDKHQFTYNTEATTGQNYTVEISDPQMEVTYLMTVGDHIVVDYSNKNVANQSVYDAVDNNLLKQDLQNLIIKYNK